MEEKSSIGYTDGKNVGSSMEDKEDQIHDLWLTQHEMQTTEEDCGEIEEFDKISEDFDASVYVTRPLHSQHHAVGYESLCCTVTISCPCSFPLTYTFHSSEVPVDSMEILYDIRRYTSPLAFLHWCNDSQGVST